MDIKALVKDWIVASNAYIPEAYLEKWHQEAVLDDLSVRSVFSGHSGIKKYFESYFIDYKTQTRLVNLKMIGPNEAQIEVVFTGEFPQKKIGGTFHFLFKDGKIAKATADLM